MEILNQVIISPCKFEGDIYLRHQYYKYSEWTYDSDQDYVLVKDDDEELEEKLEAAYQKIIKG